MTLEEGIIHAEDVARMNHEAAKHLTDEHPTQAEKCEACAEEHRQLAEWLKELKAYKEQGGDAISRQAVLDAFWKLNIELSPTAIWTIQNMVKDVPSVTPQQSKGRWIDQQDNGRKVMAF